MDGWRNKGKLDKSGTLSKMQGLSLNSLKPVVGKIQERITILYFTINGRDRGENWRLLQYIKAYSEKDRHITY